MCEWQRKRHAVLNHTMKRAIIIILIFLANAANSWRNHHSWHVSVALSFLKAIQLFNGVWTLNLESAHQQKNNKKKNKKNCTAFDINFQQIAKQGDISELEHCWASLFGKCSAGKPSGRPEAPGLHNNRQAPNKVCAHHVQIKLQSVKCTASVTLRNEEMLQWEQSWSWFKTYWWSTISQPDSKVYCTVRDPNTVY